MAQKITGGLDLCFQSTWSESGTAGTTDFISSCFLCLSCRLKLPMWKEHGQVTGRYLKMFSAGWFAIPGLYTCSHCILGQIILCALKVRRKNSITPIAPAYRSRDEDVDWKTPECWGQLRTSAPRLGTQHLASCSFFGSGMLS